MHTRSLIPLLWPAALTSYYHHPTHAQAQDPPSWQQYVRAPEAQAGIVRPVTVLPGYTLGDVENADGLVTGAAPTVLTRGGGSMEEDETPTLVVDFGQNVVGQLLLEFAGSTNGTATGSGSGFPGIRLAFSEALEFLTERSDYTRSDRAQGVGFSRAALLWLLFKAICYIGHSSELIDVKEWKGLTFLPRQDPPQLVTTGTDQVRNERYLIRILAKQI